MTFYNEYIYIYTYFETDCPSILPQKMPHIYELAAWWLNLPPNEQAKQLIIITGYTVVRIITSVYEYSILSVSFEM